MATILCVDDDPALSATLERTLKRLGHEVVLASDVPAALPALATGNVDLIISDFQMPGMTGLDFLDYLAEQGCTVPLIMLTGQASIDHAISAIKAGAVDYVAKPFERERLELSVTQALAVAQLKRENEALRGEVIALRGERQLLGDSVPMRQLAQTIATAAPTRATVLIQGESGTGKELVARALHERSDRCDKPFITLNCAALPEGLIESALFGHEKGAFTGAVKRAMGAFERADGGTLLLDEISEMRLDLQAKLLRVLQEQEFERVGGGAPLRVDVRVIATTNRDLAAEAERGTFRQDLYYRLNVITIRMPPLRERSEDIPRLVHYFAARTAAEMGKRIDGLTPDAAALLQEYQWPGNVRELQHAVERAVILSDGPLLQPLVFADLREKEGIAATRRRDAPGSGGNGEGADGGNGGGARSFNLADAERELIRGALAASGNNRTRAAELLGINVRTLRNKLNGRTGDKDEGKGPA